jgi:glyoxylase-like metal-dependent hydrolase (beta-lactamase superfamily II)
MTSRTTLALLCCLAAGPLAAQPALKHVPEVLEAGPMRIDRVKDGLYLIRGPFLPCTPNGCRPNGPDDGLYHEAGDVALRVTSRGLILVDDKFVNHVPDILELVRTVSELPIHYVLNTHHHGDHASGNAPLRAMGIDVVGHENVRANFLRIQQPGEPNIAFADKASVFSGDVEVQLLHLGRGHTSGDTVIYFPDLKTVHAGDLIVDGMPVIDYAGGGSAIAFIDTIGALVELDFDTLIPGHGRLMTKQDVVDYKARFEEMNRRMRNLARSGVPKSEVRARLYLADLDWERTVSTTTWESAVVQITNATGEPLHARLVALIPEEFFTTPAAQPVDVPPRQTVAVPIDVQSRGPSGTTYPLQAILQFTQGGIPRTIVAGTVLGIGTTPNRPMASPLAVGIAALLIALGVVGAAQRMARKRRVDGGAGPP